MREDKSYFVYIMTNPANSTLYVGVTSDLFRRVQEHKTGGLATFSSKYRLGKLVYYECFDDPNHAIAREKQLKAGSRAKKVNLITSENPLWEDLSSKR